MEFAIGTPVQPRQPGAGSLTVSKNLQLVAKSHHLELQVDASPQAGKKAVNDGNDDLAHDTDAKGHHLEKPGFLRRTEFMGGTTAESGRLFRLAGRALYDVNGWGDTGAAVPILGLDSSDTANFGFAAELELDPRASCGARFYRHNT
jgi:hypothetical protein